MIYLFYMFFSVVLLLNLLIAMLSEAFAKTQQEAILQGVCIAMQRAG